MEVIVHATPVEEKEKKESKYGKFDSWEIESAARTLKEAEEIKADPEKMKYVKLCMEESMKEMEKAIKNISSIADVKKVRQMKAEKEY